LSRKSVSPESVQHSRTIGQPRISAAKAASSAWPWELARRVGLSAPPCLRRVRALEEAGIIRGYRALLDSRTIGQPRISAAKAASSAWPWAASCTMAKHTTSWELQADGSITNVELARRVGLSAPPCLRRVRALEEAGHRPAAHLGREGGELRLALGRELHHGEAHDLVAQLRELQADGSITNVELARRVGLSAPPCLRRVRALEQHSRTIGQPRISAAKAASSAWPWAASCTMAKHTTDFLLKCVAPNLGAFQQLVGHLTGLPNVRTVRTRLVRAPGFHG
jgi:DNA-binding Lrp family transcriptional regulator